MTLHNPLHLVFPQGTGRDAGGVRGGCKISVKLGFGLSAPVRARECFGPNRGSISSLYVRRIDRRATDRPKTARAKTYSIQTFSGRKPKIGINFDNQIYDVQAWGAATRPGVDGAVSGVPASSRLPQLLRP